jgi:hypothetical protein
VRKDITDDIDIVQLVTLSKGFRILDFENRLEPYTHFLQNDALSHQESNISETHLLINKKNADVMGYMTLFSDLVKLSKEEKIEHEIINVEFMNFPALKIGKLAVDKRYEEQYKGIGTLMIQIAVGIANNVNKSGTAVRFLTVDADIINNPTVDKFYGINGFKENKEYIGKRKNFKSMRFDILK